MSDDPLSRLLPAFGTVLFKHMIEKKLNVVALASAAQLHFRDLELMQLGHMSPTLSDFFRLARALGKEPPFLLIDLINEWRADQRDPVHQSRPSDFVRLYRLGYHHSPKDFREQDRVYGSDAEATHAADRLNQQRQARGVALLDTVCLYVRLGHTNLSWKPTDGGKP